jgi:hypothetical protein
MSETAFAWIARSWLGGISSKVRPAAPVSLESAFRCCAGRHRSPHQARCAASASTASSFRFLDFPRAARFGKTYPRPTADVETSEGAVPSRTSPRPRLVDSPSEFDYAKNIPLMLQQQRLGERRGPSLSGSPERGSWGILYYVHPSKRLRQGLCSSGSASPCRVCEPMQ